MPPHLPGPPRAYSDRFRHDGRRYYTRQPFIIEVPVAVESLHSFTFTVNGHSGDAVMWTVPQALSEATAASLAQFPNTDVYLHDNTTGANWTFRNGVQVSQARAGTLRGAPDGVALGAAPDVPSSKFRKDVFLIGLSDGSGGFNVGTPAKDVAICWTGSDRSSELVRVWKKGTFGPSSDPFNSATNKDPSDVWAIPTSWGDPDTTKACWPSVQSTARTVNVDASGAFYTSQQWQPVSVVLQAYAQALGITTPAALLAFAKALADAGMTPAFITAGASCPQAVADAIHTGTLKTILKASTPGNFCAKLAAGAPPPPGYSVTAQKYMSAISGGGLVLAALLQACKDAGLDAGLATAFGDAGAACPALVRDALQAKVVAGVLALKRPSTFCADLRAATSKGRAPANPLDDPALQAALKAYADALKDDSILLLQAFFPTSDAETATPARVALFIAGSKCPVVVNDARKAGTLLSVLTYATPGTLCDELVRSMGGTVQQAPDGVSTWVKVGIAAAVVSSVIGVVAFLERQAEKKKAKKARGLMPRKTLRIHGVAW